MHFIPYKNLNDNNNSYIQLKYSNDNSYSSKDNEIKNLKEELNKTKKIVEEQKMKIKELEKEINCANDNTAEIVQSLQNEIDKRDQEINKLKKDLENKNINNNIKQELTIKESDMATVYFTSSDQRINFAIPCVKYNTFAEVEEKLYKEYPEFRETNNIFIANGNQVLRFKTIEDNKIGNGKPVMLLLPQNDD